MKSVILICADAPDLKRMSDIYNAVGSTYFESPNRLVVEGDWGWFAIGIDKELEEEFSNAEQEKIEQMLVEPVYAQLEYSCFLAANLAIKLMPVTAEVLIDNDHEKLRSIGEVRELIRAGIEWQTSLI